MSRDSASQSATEMRSRLSSFLTRNLNNLELGWPRIGPSGSHEHREPPVAGDGPGLKVLVVGDLTLELPVEVEATKAQLLAALQGRTDRSGLRWRMSKVRASGFVTHATRTAATLGAEVSVCTVVPVPLPHQLERFFEEHPVDRRFVVGLPGPSPVTVLFCCKDGTVPIRRRSVVSAAGLSWPPAAKMNFDVILADPCHLAHRDVVVHGISHCLSHSAVRPVVGLRIDSQWPRCDLAPARDGRVWSFARRRDARQLAERLAASEPGLGGRGDEDAVARCLRDECEIARLVLQLGPRGAVLMNGIPCPYHVETCQMEPVNRVGNGEALLTVTTLSSASGAGDRISLRRGVAAATGHVAGLELPRSLDELDAAEQPVIPCRAARNNSRGIAIA